MAYTFYHAVTFVLTFMSYAFFHATRKTFSNVKTTVSEEWTPSFYNETQCNNETCQPYDLWNSHHLFQKRGEDTEFLGVLDAAFMISYAVGLYISGMLGDRFNLRLVLSFGMCSSAVCVFIFGCLFEWIHFYNKYMYVLIWILNGLLQSTGWPTVVAVMGNWFGRSSRGFVLGLWSACASVGNIIGALMVSSVLDYGYDYAFLVPSSFLFAGGILNFFALVPSPKDVGLPVADEDKEKHTEDDYDSTVSVNNGQMESEPLLGSSSDVEVSGAALNRDKAVTMRQAVCLPGVALYSLAYACLKLVNYSFFFWLPFYLSNSYKWEESTADKVSIWYDIGGIIGGTIAGIISDRLEKRTLIVIPMLVLAIPSLFGYSQSPNSLVINGVLMTVVGFFVGGVSNLISAAIAADLGRQGPVAGNQKALATVTGIIDGTGSVGAAIGQLLVPAIQKEANGNWVPVFVFFMIMTFLTGVCIFPLFIREVKDMRKRYTCSWFRGCHKYPLYSDNSFEDDDEPVIIPAENEIS
ncbi:sugar phosphate exchanger 3-like isoform X2 [Mizuhopecten yessoensis]|uniref:Sugar phosphate exchanger 3 n=1 Tax=Mizuhopecten yessoensis TaxID=6573 RepID=A0A210R4Q0_MIZYE|nr:sugar phosphate exchanger 3-like isoform X2 [Mizuhopecten yessoensis]OWF55871.1 Sugar phosphate exchanger 3 [Mizuhopecten yessoensis]